VEWKHVVTMVSQGGTGGYVWDLGAKWDLWKVKPTTLFKLNGGRGGRSFLEGFALGLLEKVDPHVHGSRLRSDAPCLGLSTEGCRVKRLRVEQLMSEKCTISIICPAFDASAFLHGAVSELRAQHVPEHCHRPRFNHPIGCSLN
jgi:hypothetical protein